MPTPTTIKEATAYANELGYASPDAGEIAGAQEALDTTANMLADAQNRVTGLVANSRAARSEYAQNSAKLDQKVNKLATNYGLMDATGNKVNDINAEGSQAGAGFKFAYQADGTKVQIPQGSTAEQYGMSSTPPASTVTNATKTDGKQAVTDPYQTQMNDENARIAKEKDEYEKKMEEYKKTNDETYNTLLDSIKATYNARLLKMQDINSRYLEGTRIAGISSGRQRYAPTLNQGLLSTEEMDGQARLAEIEAQQLSAIAQAKQARDTMDYKLFNDEMANIEKMNAEKLSIVTKLHEDSIAQDKILEDKRRNAFAEKQTLQQNSLKMADSLASSVYSGLNSLKGDEEKQAYMETISKKYGIDPEVLQSSAIEYGQKASREELEQANIRSQMSEREKKGQEGSASDKKNVAYSNIDYAMSAEAQKDAQKKFKVSFIDKEGYLTSEGLEMVLETGRVGGLTRKQVLEHVANRLWIGKGGKNNYGLPLAEAKDYISSTEGGSERFITEEFLKTIGRGTMTEVEAYRKGGLTDDKIVKLLEEKE